MANILEEIVAHKRMEVALAKERLSPHEIHARVEAVLAGAVGAGVAASAGATAMVNGVAPCGGGLALSGAAALAKVPSMREALVGSSCGIIAEFKRKSPSKGWIKPEGRADEIPLSYQEAGATALSILADEKYFAGSDEFIAVACRSGVTIPIIYKNFVVDEYQLFQARLCGASAVLLIASDLSLSECKALMSTAHEIGLEVLLEMHTEEELEYAALEPDMYGINNRNLKTFVTDVRMSYELADRLPAGACKVSESGISSPATVRELRAAGFRGFLIGENFMKTPSPGDALRQFIAELCW